MEGNALLVAKALHIIFVVAWFAGLFYIPRLFIYQTEALDKPAAESGVLIPQLQLMSWRLWYIITWPGCVLATLFALWMLYLVPAYLQMPWMHLKLGMVALLLIYHGSIHWIFLRLQRNKYPLSAGKLRFYNEVATLLLFAIVFTVVFKNTSGWYYGVLGIVALGVVLSLGVMLYKRVRQK